MSLFPVDAGDDDLTTVATSKRVLVCEGCDEAEAVLECESCGDHLCLDCWGDGDPFCEACLEEAPEGRPIHDVEVGDGFL